MNATWWAIKKLYMTPREFEFFQKTYKDFLLNQKKKNAVKIRYYFIPRKSGGYHCSLIGYSTNGGLHGIHYNRTKNRYHFGHLNPKTGSILIGLNPSQEMEIPSRLKDGLLNAANNRLNIVCLLYTS